MSIWVYPGAKKPTHEISLSDGVQTWGLRLDGGPMAIQEMALTPSTLHIAGGSSKFGDWEPGLAHIGQNSWLGGRGMADLSQDNSRYLDGHMAFTLIDGKLLPAPQWRYGRGCRASIQHLPGDVRWQALLGTCRYLSTSLLTGGNGFTAYKACLWLRRCGSPRPLKLTLHQDNGGTPGQAISGALGSLSAGQVDQLCSCWTKVEFELAPPLSADTVYHLLLEADAGDSRANHWLVGIDRHSAASLCSQDGQSWEGAGCRLYHQLADQDQGRRFRFFTLQEALYAVDQPCDGSASRLYLNGERGAVTGASRATLQDDHKNWAPDEWKGCWLRIIAGSGKDQQRRISGNSSNTLLLDEWDVMPAPDSRYLIYASDTWTDISPLSGDQIEVPVLDVLAMGDQVWLARGGSRPILRMRWNDAVSPPRHEFDDDGGNTADLLYGLVDAQNQYQIWRARNSNVAISRAKKPSWGSAASFSADIPVGEGAVEISNFHQHNDCLYVFKRDGLYQVEEDVPRRLDTGLEFAPSPNTGQAVCSRNFFSYFSWGDHALLQLHTNDSRSELSALGPDKDEGLPEDRRGCISALAYHPGGLLAAVDAGQAGYSSVLLRLDPAGWHEVFRAPNRGQRIRAIHWQHNPGANPRLWIDLGDEIACQVWPRHGLNPLADSAVRYQHEASLTLADIDMGAIRLPKLIKQLSLLTANLGSQAQVAVDYQLDGDIGGSHWQQAGSARRSPFDAVEIERGRVYKIRLRLRLCTEDARQPPLVLASVLEGCARTPLKFQWNLRVKLGDCQRQLSGLNADHDPDELLNWLKQAAVEARCIRMCSIWEQLHGKTVLVEPPGTLQQASSNVLEYWGGSLDLVLREV